MGQLLRVIHIRNGYKFPPPVGGVHQADLPIQQNFHVFNRWLRWVTASSTDVWYPSGMHHILPSGGQGNPTAPFNMHPKRTFPGFSVGYLALGLHFQKVTCPESHLPLQPMLAGGTWQIQRFVPGVTSIVPTEAWMGGISHPLT